MPTVEECLLRAISDMSSGTSEGIVSAAIFLATASRSLERESFRLVCRAVDLSPVVDASTAEFLQDGMEAVFDSVLESLGHLCFSLSGGIDKDKNKALTTACENAATAQHDWAQLQQLSFQRQPHGVQ